jgi:CRP-like cAMP-binding protein
MISTTGARRLHKGDVVVLAGTTPQQGLCYILSGAIRIVHRLGAGALNVGVLKAGQFFGEYSLVLERPTDFDAIAVEDGTAIMFLNHDRFLKEARANPVILKELLATAMNRLGLVMQTLGKLNVPVRIEAPADLERVVAENRQRNLEIPRLVNNTRSAFVARGRSIFQQRQPNDGNLYLVTEGWIEARLDLDDYSGEALRFMPGDMFGFTRVATQPVRAYSANAGIDSRIMTFDQEYLLRLLQLNMDCFWTVFRSAVIQIILLDNALHHSVEQADTPQAPPELRVLITSLKID